MTVLKCTFYYSGIMSLTDEMIATEKVVYYLSEFPRGGDTLRHAAQGHKGSTRVGQETGSKGESAVKCVYCGCRGKE